MHLKRKLAQFCFRLLIFRWAINNSEVNFSLACAASPVEMISPYLAAGALRLWALDLASPRRRHHQHRRIARAAAAVVVVSGNLGRIFRVAQ